MHSVLVGPSDKDPWTLAGGGQRPLSPKLAGEDLSGVRIGYVELMGRNLQSLREGLGCR
jgi:hypothetical protein